jgi:hypothetical protein
MPSIILNDQLQSYTPGTGIPSQFELTGIAFVYEFIDFDAGRPPTPAPGFYERTGIGYFFFGNNLQFPTNSNLSLYPLSSASIFWAGLGFPKFSVMSLSSTSPYQGPTILTTSLESDYSMSVVVPGVAPNANSLKQVFFENTWQYWQITVLIGEIMVSGVLYATIQYQVAVDGIQIFNTGIPYTTGIPIVDMYLGAPLINAWEWTGSSYYGEFTFYNGLTAFPFFPNESATINMFESQVVAEYVGQPFNINMRKSQDVTEVVQKPSDRNMRKSQDIIELIVHGNFNPGGTGGFYVRES